jgi:hypothetical protein
VCSHPHALTRARAQKHTQTQKDDGWFSSKSAAAYETSTEALFFGRQDAMQRASLLALHEWLVDTGRCVFVSSCCYWWSWWFAVCLLC